MTCKRLATLTLVLVSCISALGQSAAYPARRGIVTDYAGRLDRTQIDELTALIQQYERQTSIEFAVVVVDSLQGQSAREYAEGIGDAWGVGKAGRNNGIVLLWAPHERKYSLRIAEGLSADLTDADATRITQENLLPNFKNEQYYEGLKQTVLAVMQQLGGQSWEERLKARAERTRANAESEKLEIWGAVGDLIFLVLVVLTGVWLYRWRQRKKKLAEMDEASRVIPESLRTAEQNAPKIQQLLTDLSKEMPEQDLGKLSSELAAQPNRIAEIKADAARTNFTDIVSYDEVIDVRNRAQTEGDFLGTMRMRVAEIKTARERSQTLMEQLGKQNFEITQVVDSSKREEVDRLLAQSRLQYEQARQNSSHSLLDWLIISELLSNSYNQSQQAVQVSQAPPYVPTFDSSDSTSSSSSFFSSDGGSSGGGGGFSSGSGSDGSY
jgi:uncharacterized membrane protein YgcG